MKKTLNKNKSTKKQLRTGAILIIAAAIIFIFSSCSRAAVKDEYYQSGNIDAPGFSNSTTSELEKPVEGLEGSSDSKINEKLIKKVDISAETLKFDEARNDILELVSKAGGYISNSKISGGERYEYSGRSRKYAEFEIRIPQDKLSEFLKEVDGRISIYASQENVTDATETYYDIQARLETLNSKKEALTEMLSKAENTTQLLDIQDKLYQTIAEIESYKSRLLVIDSQVDYSTVYLRLYEVEEYTQIEEEPFGKRVSDSFKEGWETFAEGWKDFAVWFVGAIPGLLVFAVIVVANVFIIRAIVRKCRKISAEKAEAARLAREANQAQFAGGNGSPYYYSGNQGQNGQ